MPNNSINTSNNIFASFPKYEAEHSSSLKSYKIKNEKQEDILQISNNNKSVKNTAKIASSIFAAGIIGLIFAKGLNFGSLQYYTHKGGEKVSVFSNAIANITPIKDVICEKVCNLTRWTAKFAEGTRQLFRKIVDRAMGQKYDKVSSQVSDMTSLLQKYSIPDVLQGDKNKLVKIKGVEHTVEEWCGLLKKHTAEMEQFFGAGFSLGARKARGAKRDGLLKGLREKVYNVLFKDKGIFKSQTYDGYLTAEMSSGIQKELQTDILSARKKVTNNIEAIYEGIKTKLGEIRHSIKPTDKQTNEILQTTNQKLKSFAQCSGAAEAKARQAISSQIIDDIDKAISQISAGGSYSAKEQQELISKLNEIKGSILNSGEKGALENIMTVLSGLNKQTGKNGQKIISDKEYKQFEKLAKNISTGLKKAADIEIDDYFLKHAEMEVGSAATDVLGLLMPVGAGIYAIAKSEDKDERISTTLKTGIPLIGGFLTCAYGTTKMIGGIKNLSMGLITGILLNKAGNYVDNLYKQYKKTGSIKKVAKSEYKNLKSDMGK